jgi:NAD(P)H-dependent flavin oxidoreductase YrpB (nitropropane dioxygenase family)
MISTPLTRLLGVRCPVVCSPMAGAAGGLLAARVHRGGGFGFIAGGHQPGTTNSLAAQCRTNVLTLADGTS